MGTNINIDKAITKDYLRNCWIVLTSRETKALTDIRQYMDVEAEITGFDNQRVEEYATKYLGSRAKCKELLENAERCEIFNCILDYGILRIPILLHMICFLFNLKVSFHKRKTGILSDIVDRCIDWETIRKTGKKNMKDVKAAVIKLGKLAMKGLKRDHLQQIFGKV